MNDSNLKSKRLTLVPATAETLAFAADDDHASLAKALSVRVPADWPPRIDGEGRMALEGFKYVRDLLQRNSSLVGWWGWWVLLLLPAPMLIGVVSTKGPPSGGGIVEVAYGIVDSYQGKGYATEATLALMTWVRSDPRVRKIVAETLPHLAASIGVMEKCGLSFLGEGSEPGTIRFGLRVERS